LEHLLVNRNESLQGEVFSSLFAPGSKSEHEAVMIRATDGREWKLVRRDGNPFVDPVLDSLIGKTIIVEGVDAGSSFIADNWKEL